MEDAFEEIHGYCTTAAGLIVMMLVKRRASLRLLTVVRSNLEMALVSVNNLMNDINTKGKEDD